MNPLVNVVIPTRERADVLESALRTVTAQRYSNLRIIVSDNWSQDDTAGVVRRANDSRITYVNTGKRVSMSHNWEFAVSQVEDGWVTVMGDDDGLMPDAIARVADIITSTGAQAIRTDMVHFEWPGVHPGEYGRLIVPLGSGHEERDGRQWLERTALGRSEYVDLPLLYNGGFIHFSLLDHIRRRTGLFFRSWVPDVYSAVAIASVVPKYLFVREPLAISGASRHSTGYSSCSADPKRNRAPALTFLSEDHLPIHPDLVATPHESVSLTLQMLVYESLLQSAALRDFGIAAESPADQLPVILASNEERGDALRSWGRRFAAVHAIDFDVALRRASELRARRRREILVRKVQRATRNLYTVRAPVRNVSEASIAAGVLRARPSRRDSLLHMLSRVVSAEYGTR